MKKIAFILGSVFMVYNTYAQSYLGYLTDNYSGVNSIINNPAHIVDSPYKLDFNLVSFSAFAGNDYYGVNALKAIKSNYNFDNDSKKFPSENNNAEFNIDVLGPSVLYSINDNNSIALFTRVRAIGNVNNINGHTVGLLEDKDAEDYHINEGDFNTFGQAWKEFGATFGRVVYNENGHFLKAAVTAKYLKGIGSAYVSGKNVTIDYDADGTDLGNGETTGSINSTGEITYGRFANFDNKDYKYKAPNATGFGADLGFVYEWRPENDYNTYLKGETSLRKVNQYKFKVGLAITDFGSINYKDAKEEVYDVTNTNVSEKDIKDADSYEDALNNLYTKTSEKTGYTTKLPMAAQLSADYNINNNWYVNLNTGISLVSKTKLGASHISNHVSITPRFETKWYGVYLPVSYIENIGLQAGFGFRAGPIFIGSGSLISVLPNNKNKGADFYAGIKIPIYKPSKYNSESDYEYGKSREYEIEEKGEKVKIKESDEKIVKVYDKRTTVEENKVALKEKVITETPAVKVEQKVNATTDVKTEVVKEVAKKVEPKELVENKVAPQTQKEVLQQKFDEFTQDVSFPTGGATIDINTLKPLLQISDYMQADTKIEIEVEGYADKTGSEAANNSISKLRASMVRLQLMKLGIDMDRISIVGKGSTDQFSGDNSAAGRSKNRRIRIVVK